MTLEREDIGGGARDPLLIAMHRVAEPFGEARDDYDIFAALAGRLAAAHGFTEGRTAREWLRAPVREDCARRCGRAAIRRRISTSSGGWESRALPHVPDDGGSCGRSATTPSAASAAHPERPDRDLLRDHRRVRLRRLPGAPGLAAAASDGARGRGTVRCSWSPTSRPRGCTASSTSAATAGQQDRGPRGRAACTRAMRRHGASRTATSSGCSTIAARAWPRRVLTEDVRAGRGAASHRRLVRSRGPRADKPLCVHGNPNVLTRDVGTSQPGAGLHGAALRRGGGALRGQSAPHQRVHLSRGSGRGQDAKRRG